MRGKRVCYAPMRAVHLCSSRYIIVLVLHLRVPQTDSRVLIVPPCFYRSMLSALEGLFMLLRNLFLLAALWFSPLSADANSSVIDFLTKRDLELTCSVNESHAGVVACLDCTVTTAGKALMHSLLLQPTTDMRVLHERQAALKALLSDRTTFQRLKQQLRVVAATEPALAFFAAAHAEPTLRTVIESFLYQSSSFQEWNESERALNVRHILQSFSPVITAAFEYLVLHYAMEYVITRFGDGHDHHHGHDHGHHHHATCGCGVQAPDHAPWLVKALVFAAKAGHVALHAISIKDMVEFISAKMAVMNQVYNHLAQVQQYVDAARVLVERAPLGLVSADTMLALSQVQELFPDDYFVRSDADVSLGLCSLVGRTLVTYNRLREHKTQLASIHYAVAQIDAFVGVAQLMDQHSGTLHPYCFASFVKDAAAPYLEVVDGWHPLLPATNVVANSLDAATQHHFVLTGPNRSGKSSFMRMLGLNAVLAQTFGIAAARAFTLTPFDKIMTFMTIADDMVQGQSSFVARMMRADACIQAQQTLPADHFALILLDDSVGQGTTVEKGEQVAYELAQVLGSYDNNIVLCATHFPRLTQLAAQTGGRFANLRMRVHMNSDGSAQGAYLLEPGISDVQNVGILVNRR